MSPDGAPDATAGTSAPLAVPDAGRVHGILPVILSGGAGTRLWPLSRSLYPKQFLPLAPNQDTLLASAIRRNFDAGAVAPLVICHQDHRFLVAEDLRRHGIAGATILLEPEGRNTAPAAVVAALLAARRDPQQLILIAPSDHIIADGPDYHQALQRAAAGAAAGAVVTFGIRPTRPETGYGYLRRTEDEAAPGCYWLERFIEKPSLAWATEALKDQRYSWNSGMFVFRADRMLADAERLIPETLAACRSALAAARVEGEFIWLDADAFRACPPAAIDTAIMERTERTAMVPFDAAWSDLGSWESLWESAPKDVAGNFQSGDVTPRDTRNSYLWAADDLLLATIGLEDMVVVATSDAVLVCPRARSQEVKQLVDALKARGRTEPHTHVLVRRPWGAYESLSGGDRFQVKRLVVNPGRRLSLQMHYHRSEHWVVVRGTARITNGDREIMLFENESTYIAAGTRHRLENPGLIPLEIVEVQSGSYLGEDDIVRLDDDYGRG